MKTFVGIVLLVFMSAPLFAQEGGDETMFTNCFDGIDNDGDGLVDCDDPECAGLIDCNDCSPLNQAYGDVVLFYDQTCTDTTNRYQDASRIIGRPNFSGFGDGAEIVSIGNGGRIQVGFTDNTLINSGTPKLDLGVFEVGADMESVMIALRPDDAFTREVLNSSTLSDTEGDDHWEFGFISGGRSGLDIDLYFEEAFSPGRLRFNSVMLVDEGQSDCNSSTPGADLDAICCQFLLVEEICGNGIDDDFDGLTDENIECDCELSTDLIIMLSGDLCIDGVDFTSDFVGEGEFQWYKDGEILEGATSSSLFSVVDEGYYELSVSNDSICIYSQPVVLKKPFLLESVTRHICQGEVFQFGDQQLIEEGQYVDTLQSILNGCDSIVRLNLRVSSDTTVEIFREFCEGDSIFYLGKPIKEDTVFVENRTNIFGCDSTVIINIDKVAVVMDSVAFELCQGDSLVYRGLTLGAGFNDVIRLPSLIGCDTFVEVEIFSIATTEFVDTSIALCFVDLESYDFLGQAFPESGNYEIFESLDSSCVQYNVNIYVIGEEEYDTLLFLCPQSIASLNGVTYVAAGNYEQTVIEGNGCETLLNVQVVNAQESVHQLEFSICEGDSIELNGMYYFENGNYEQILLNSVGCDSILHIDITTIPLASENLDIVLCKGDSIEVNGDIFFTSGQFRQTIQTHSNCDSLLIIDVQVLEFDTLYSSYALCSGDSITIGDLRIFQPGSYLREYQDDNGCDIVEQITVTEDFNCDQCFDATRFSTDNLGQAFRIRKLDPLHYDVSWYEMNEVVDFEALSKWIAVKLSIDYLKDLKSINAAHIDTQLKQLKQLRESSTPVQNTAAYLSCELSSKDLYLINQKYNKTMALISRMKPTQLLQLDQY